jgi:hypothetical protein
VGWTNQTLAARLSAHIADAKHHPRTYRACWINALRGQGIRPGIRLLELTDDYAEAEIRWIADLRARGFELTNGTAGGRGVLGARWKLSQQQIGALKARPPRVMAPEEIEAMRQRALGNQNWLGKHHSEETKAKLRAAWAEKRRQRRVAREGQESITPTRRPPSFRGRSHSEETKLRLSELGRGRVQSAEPVRSALPHLVMSRQVGAFESVAPGGVAR